MRYARLADIRWQLRNVRLPPENGHAHRAQYLCEAQRAVIRLSGASPAHA